MATKTGTCPRCHAVNSYGAINCLDCGQRLPWGDAAQAAQDQINAAKAQAQQAQQTAQAQQAQQAATQNNSPVATGRFCPKCGKVITGTTNYCSRCGYSLNAFNDEPSFGFALLGFLIPIVGLIVFLVMRDNSPERAHSAGKGAIAGVVVGFLCSIVLFFLNPDVMILRPGSLRTVPVIIRSDKDTPSAEPRTNLAPSQSPEFKAYSEFAANVNKSVAAQADVLGHWWQAVSDSKNQWPQPDTTDAVTKLNSIHGSLGQLLKTQEALKIPLGYEEVHASLQQTLEMQDKSLGELIDGLQFKDLPVINRGEEYFQEADKALDKANTEFHKRGM
jgi:hypothetical protein